MQTGSWLLGKWGKDCVSIKISDEKVQVRDTKDSTKATLTFNTTEWKAFVDGVKKGEFDI